MPRSKSTAATEEVWTTVADESSAVLIMDTPGDQFTGTFLGSEGINPPTGEPFSRFIFRGEDGELYSMNKSHKLSQALDDVPEGSRVRVTLIKFVTLTGDGREDQNPMKDYRVEVAAR